MKHVEPILLVSMIAALYVTSAFVVFDCLWRAPISVKGPHRS
jgi:hypothetical protein